jgi:FAD/FMN-containing dehydrogenase
MSSENNTKAAERALAIPELRTMFQGQVIAPGDAGYDQARTVFYAGFDRRPAVIIRAADAAEVAQVLQLARESGLELAVRSGGHSVPGHSSTEGGILLDLGNLKELKIDVEGRSAWAGTGLTAAEYTTAAGAHGLATGFGDTGTVGIGGITLGGGIGYLLRKYGLTIDNLLAADLVTADGQLLRVDPGSHPDLFWAIRGGGGNFGVATRFQFRLQNVDKIVGGMLILPATPQVIDGFIAAAEAAPDELSSIANVMTAPPMPFLPPELHGKTILLATMVYAGDEEEGLKAIAPLRALAAPLADMLRPMRYPEMFPPDESGFHPLAASRNMFVDHIDQAVAETILEHIRSSKATMAAAQLRVLGGAMARVPVESTAFAHRKSRIMLNIAALYQQPGQKAEHEAWASNFEAALKQSDAGAYVNFMGEVSPERLRSAYPGATWQRLAAIKAKYDPQNLFRLNHNIPPGG